MKNWRITAKKENDTQTWSEKTTFGKGQKEWKGQIR